MATPLTKFNSFNRRMANGDFRDCLNADTDTLRVYLSNAAPDVVSMVTKADLAEIPFGNGYTAPIDTQNAATNSNGTINVVGADIVITAGPAALGPFQYVVLFADILDQPLVGYWSYGMPLTLQPGEKFTLDFTTAMLSVQ